ncbi:MAG: I78 family peptidase inhibitor [Sulfitobacter sp.]
MRTLLVISGALALAACNEAQSFDTTCNAANWQDLVGQPEAAVHSVLGNVRIIHAGDAVSTDINRNRLNAEIGKDGRVKRFACY